MPVTPDVRGLHHDHVSQATMSKVQARTILARITPGRSGFDIRTFECPSCDHVHQRVVALVDPMKSDKTAGWFRGELRAPTA